MHTTQFLFDRENKDKFVRCPICFKQFANELFLSTHKKTKHVKNKVTICKICGIVVQKRNWKSHSIIHKKVTAFKCLSCEKLYESKPAFLRHIHKHDENPKHICSICGKSFYRKDHLKLHLKTHKQ